MTNSYKNLLPQQTTSHKNDNLKNLLSKLKNKPFYCGKPFKSIQTYCCTWHTLPPLRPDSEQPSELYEWQKGVMSDLENFKKVASVKCRGAGLSELSMMYALHLTLSTQKRGNIMFISGIGYSHIRDLARRVREKFAQHDIYFDLDNNITLTFPNGIRWEFFGSDSRSWRGRTNCIYLVADELVTFDENSLPLSAIDTYTIKHPSAIVWLITTPSYNVAGFAFRLFNEPDDSKILYHRQYISYKTCLGTLLDPAAIKLLSETSPTFNTEYGLVWGGGQTEGLVFTPKNISDALYIPYSVAETTANYNSPKSLGLDYGMTGGSLLGGGFSAVVTAFEDNIIKVLDARLWIDSDYNDVLDEIRNMIQLYDPVKIYADGSAVSFCRSLCMLPEVNEDPNYQEVMRRYKEMYKGMYMQYFENNNKVIPISWMKYQSRMLGNLKMLFDKQTIAIDQQFDKLIAALKSCVALNGRVNKSVSTYNDLIDGLMLSCHEYEETKA